MLGQTILIENDQQFMDFVDRIPWISYRSDFRQINSFTTDSGWGCMIRAGQMMFAQTMMQLKLREIKGELVSVLLHNFQTDHKRSMIFKDAVSMFLDNEEEKEAPFSIQNIIPIGERLYKKTAGIWFGANSISH